MLKRVKVEELRPGDFIKRFDCGWLEHPFLFSSRKVDSPDEIERIKDWGISHVYIQSSEEAATPHPKAPLPPPPAKLPAPAKAPAGQPARLDPEMLHIPIHHEIARARRVKERATLAAKRILADVQNGKKVKEEEAYQAVSALDNSITHNKDALLLLMKLRNKDEYTFEHSVNVGVLLLAFCHALNLDAETTKIIGMGGLLHDVGKMAVPLNLLNKPAALSEIEYHKIQQHVVYCQEIMAANPNIPQAAAQIATQHHERFDGTGYIHGLTGMEISQGGQMAAIADVFDALTADRCYRSGIDQVEVLRKLYGWSKSHFNEELVHRFIRCIGIYPPGTLVQLESGLIGVVVESTDNLMLPVVRVVYDAQHDWAVRQRDINLAQNSGKGGSDRIVCYESAKRWGINPLKVIGLV